MTEHAAPVPPASATIDALSVVVPMLNEADNVQQLAAEVHEALADRLDYELIIVDDGSTDTTVERVRDAARQLGHTRLVRHRQRCGQSTALHSGVSAARHAWIAVLDGDLQNDPRDIRRLLAEWRQHPRREHIALVMGNRTSRKDTMARRISSRIANSVRARFLHDETPDTGCGLKLFRRSVFLELPYFDHMHRFLPALVQQLGLQVVSVPVGHRPRVHGNSKYGLHNRLWVGLVDLLGVAWLARRNRRTDWMEEKL